jgi:hypothetical protein
MFKYYARLLTEEKREWKSPKESSEGSCGLVVDNKDQM